MLQRRSFPISTRTIFSSSDMKNETMPNEMIGGRADDRLSATLMSPHHVARLASIGEALYASRYASAREGHAQGVQRSEAPRRRARQRCQGHAHRHGRGARGLGHYRGLSVILFPPRPI